MPPPLAVVDYLSDDEPQQIVPAVDELSDDGAQAAPARGHALLRKRKYLEQDQVTEHFRRLRLVVQSKVFQPYMQESVEKRSSRFAGSFAEAFADTPASKARSRSGGSWFAHRFLQIFETICFLSCAISFERVLVQGILNFKNHSISSVSLSMDFIKYHDGEM